MAKYSAEELKTMAKRVLQARDENDDRYLEFVLVLSHATGVPVNEVVERIQKMAES